MLVALQDITMKLADQVVPARRAEWQGKTVPGLQSLNEVHWARSCPLTEVGLLYVTLPQSGSKSYIEILPWRKCMAYLMPQILGFLMRSLLQGVNLFYQCDDHAQDYPGRASWLGHASLLM